MNPVTSNLSTNVLGPAHQRVFDQLETFKETGYLAGGTGLALQLGHRKSFDFDIFTQNKITPQARENVIQLFGQNIRFTMDTPEQLTWITDQEIKITLAYTPYAPLHPVIKTSSISLAGIEDIASDKAFTIGRRGQYRDYVDLAFILKSGRQLAAIIQETQKRYQALFDEKLFLEQLDYLDDLTELTVDFIADPLTPDQVKDFLHHQIKAYLASQKITA